MCCYVLRLSSVMSTTNNNTTATAATAPSGRKKRRAAAVAAESTSGVLEFLQSSLDRSVLLQLYAEESRGRFVCRAVFQRLPKVGQQVIVRLSCCGGSFPKTGSASISAWTKDVSFLAELYRWAIIDDVKGDNVTLTPQFALGVRGALCDAESSPWSCLTRVQMEALENQDTAKQVTPEDLERYTQSQWDAVLHFLVGTPNMAKSPPPAVVHFLLLTGLMQVDPEYRGADEEEAPLVITQKGYDFMLQDNQQQVWHFVRNYLQSLQSYEKHEELQQEALLFLICLSFCRVGEAYPASCLSKHGRNLMRDLTYFGLLYVRKIGKQSIFYPTRVAVQMVGHEEDDSSSALWTLSSKALEAALAHPKPHDSSHLGIIVQTNFQLCAYTTSELHVSMLGLFCDVQTIRRLPNVVFMQITRVSIKTCFNLGVQARQILRFLEKHAHPKLRTTESAIPSNVVDQIWLWDRERHRVQWTEVYHHQCKLQGEFQAVLKFTRKTNSHVWSSESRNEIFIDYSEVEQVQAFVRQWRAKTAAGGQAN